MKAQEKLSKLIEHNAAIYKGDQIGTLKKNDVIDAYQENFESFATEIIETRQGRTQDKFGRKVPAHDVSFAEAITRYFGIVAPERNEFGGTFSKRDREMFVIRQFLKQNEVFLGTDTIETAAMRFGCGHLSLSGLNDMLIKHSQFNATNNTSQINSDYRFLIPEIIMAAIRLDYEGGSMHQNWISNTVNISQREVTMPNIRRGNTNIRKIGEAESIPFGTVRFGQKKASVFKIGTGFKITDELVSDSTLDLLFEFMGEVGTDMSIGADVEAAKILINGEQDNLSESSPVIGVDNIANGVRYKDLRRAIARMTRLKRDVKRVLTTEDAGIDLSLLDEFKGFSGSTTLSNLQQIIGMPANLINDIFVLPANQIMLLAPEKAMMKLAYQGLKVETRRNPQNQEDEMFVSDHVGFAIKRRDARIIIDNTLDFATNGFPAYMDIDKRISQSYKTVND